MTSSWPSPRGEVAKRGWESGVDKHNITTAADLGLRGDRTSILADHENTLSMSAVIE
ncbi:hypothetical protein N9C56_10500 [Paracoccaceae bacterium]|nr:hypothetical protein [Paracoccaceae bacterium]